MIRIEHNGIAYFCETVEEAVQLGQRLQGEASQFPTATALHPQPHTSWTPDLYQRLLARIGPLQRKALDVMLDKRTVTGEYLCEQVGVEGTQALAGVLSSISRQAAALGVSARSIFTIEVSRRGGDR